MIFTIFIPSKSRSDSSTVGKYLNNLTNLNEDNIQFYMVIPKNQESDYLQYYNSRNIITTPNKVKGITKTRQFILNEARKMNLKWIWMIDDDLTNFFIRPKTLNSGSRSLKKISMLEFLRKGQKVITKIKKKDKDLYGQISQIGFKKSTFAIPKSSISFNTDLGDIVGLHIDAITNKNLNYDTKMITLEDTDLTVRCIKSGLYNIKLNHYIFTAPYSGTSKGGLEQVYKAGGKQRGMKQFQTKYPDLINITDLERGKYRIKWNKLKLSKIIHDKLSKIV